MRGGPEEHAHVEHFGGNAGGAAGGKGCLFPFLRKSPETEDVHKGSRDDVRAGKRAGAVAITVSRTTFASRPTKVPAPPRRRMCDTGHDDPGLQPEDLLRRHTEQQEINVISIKTVVAVHPTRIARTTSVRWTSFCMHVGLVPSRNKHAKNVAARTREC